MILTHRPVPQAVNQGFGEGATQNNPHPVYGNYQPVGHLAVDFGCPEGTPIVAAASGTVVYAGWGEDMPEAIAVKYGYIVGAEGWASGLITIIDHGDGTATAYSHQSAVHVTRGQKVAGGNHIGDVGSTGRSTGPHLHFEYMTLPINYSSSYYSRSDPMAQFGSASIAPASSNIEQSEEDFMAGTIDGQQAEDIAQRAAKLVLEGLMDVLDNKVRINAVQAESIVQATTSRTSEAVDANANGKTINRQQADDIAKAAAAYSKGGK